MSSKSNQFHDLLYIILRNLLVLTNGVIFSVVALLFFFGDTREALFLGLIAVMNISFSLIQNITAWNALQKLQLLTAPQVTRLNKDGTEELVLAEKIQKGDTLKLKIGDQIPCDSTLVEAFNFEINKGLITGESNSIPCQKEEKLLAGSIVTSGSGTVITDTDFYESRIARMTGTVKTYKVNTSPIQQAVDTVSKYSGYILIATLIFVVTRGLLLHETNLNITLQVGTMASMLVPQGIAFTVTIFFAYGSANLFKKHVLLQEMNAAEKLGRIQNLCMDKTGTITENKLSVKEIITTSKLNKAEALALSFAYIKATKDSSQTIEAIQRFIGNDFTKEDPKEVLQVLPFSSWRQYGAIQLKKANGLVSVFAGPPQILFPYIKNEVDKKWLENFLLNQADTGERILCFMKDESEEVDLNELKTAKLSIVGVYVFYNVLREGIHDTINFFQERGVNIRIISGDNPETVQAVTAAAGIKNSDKIITGEEMKTWKLEDFENKIKLYSIFAGVLPEQKKQIVEALKKEGFTAMIGDGANDAMAIKSADLGIAMLDGVPAVRQLASVVLMTNSFSSLPGGVKLADNIIRYTEMFTSMFLNQTLIGLFFFIAVSLFNYDYPITPFNITLINYFTIGIPGLLISSWVIWPRGVVPPVDSRPFLKRVLPFALTSSIFQAIGVALSFAFFVRYLNLTEVNTLVVMAFIILGFSFFLFVPKVYQGLVEKVQIIQIIVLGVLEFLLLIAVFRLPTLTLFFNISRINISLTNTFWLLLILSPFFLIQYFVARYFISLPKNK